MSATLNSEELLRLARADFGMFAQSMFNVVTPGVTLVWASYLDLICAKLEAVAHGRIKRLIVTMPPRHLKSYCVSVALPAYYLGHYPTKHVMAISYGGDLSKKFADDFQRLVDSVGYKDLFGELMSRGRQPLANLQTYAGGSRRATSIDGTATGLGADLIIFDDPQKPGETPSDALRRSTNEAYETTFMSRRNDPATAAVVIVMQRLHEDDFVNHVQSRGEEWEVLNLPAIAEEDEYISYETFVSRGVFERRAGEALHPGRMPLDVLETLRQAMGESVFATQYQQRPAPRGGGLVKDAWFKRYRPDELPEKFERIIQSWDTANTVEQYSGYSVCTTWGVKGDHIYLLAVFRRRLLYPDLRRAALEQAQVHRAEVVYIEDKASGTQLLQELRGAGDGRFTAVKPTGDKQMRMANQTARIEGGYVHVPDEAHWLAEYLHELTVFPNGKFADQVDSTSQALDNAFAYRNGMGLWEFFRREAEELERQEREIWVMRPPAAVNMFQDIEGKQHWLQPDGCFHLPRREAMRVVNKIGWSRVS